MRENAALRAATTLHHGLTSHLFPSIPLKTYEGQMKPQFKNAETRQQKDSIGVSIEEARTIATHASKFVNGRRRIGQRQWAF